MMGVCLVQYPKCLTKRLRVLAMLFMCDLKFLLFHMTYDNFIFLSVGVSLCIVYATLEPELKECPPSLSNSGIIQIVIYELFELFVTELKFLDRN